MPEVNQIGKGVKGVNPGFEQIKPKLGGTTGSTIRQQFDGRYIVVDQTGMKVAGPYDSPTGAFDAAQNRDSVFLRNALIDAVPVISFLSWTGFSIGNPWGVTGPHG